MIENKQIRLATKTAAQWTVDNNVLLLGQKGIESDTYLEKTGDGVTPWIDLPYLHVNAGDVYGLTQGRDRYKGLFYTFDELNAVVDVLEGDYAFIPGGEHKNADTGYYIYTNTGWVRYSTGNGFFLGKFPSLETAQANSNYWFGDYVIINSNVYMFTNIGWTLLNGGGGEPSHFRGVYANTATLTTIPNLVVGDYAQVDGGVGNNVETYVWDEQDGWILLNSNASILNTDQLVEGTNNLYFTQDRVINTIDDAAVTFTNKRNVFRVSVITSSATPSLNIDSYDILNITSLAEDITGFNITGTPTLEQALIVNITGTGTRNITWGSSFESSSVLLPTTVSTDKKTIGFMYNDVTSKWRCIGVS